MCWLCTALSLCWRFEHDTLQNSDKNNTELLYLVGAVCEFLSLILAVVFLKCCVNPPKFCQASQILISPAFSLLSHLCFLKMLWTATSFSIPLAVERNREACRVSVIVFPFAHHQLCQQPLSYCWIFVNVSTIRIKPCLSALFLWMVSHTYGLSVDLYSH